MTLQLTYYGEQLIAGKPQAIYLFIGSLELANSTAERRPDALVMAVGDSGQKELSSKAQNLSIFSEVSLALNGILKESKRVDFVVFDAPLCTLDLFASLKGNIVGHLCGSYDEAELDAVDLYRRSNEIAESFYWRSSSGQIIQGKQHKGPEVSIIVPAYKIEKYLDVCIETLSNQTLQDREIIIVDDGSPDSSGQIADNWASKDHTIRVIHKVNGGCASARLAGMLAAKGRYIGFVDGDDWVDYEMFERLFRLAVINQAEVSQVGFKKVFENTGLVEKHYDWLGDIEVPSTNGDLIWSTEAKLLSQPSIWRRIYRADFLRSHSISFPEQFRFYDDLYFNFMTMMHVRRLAARREHLYSYRLGLADQTVSFADERVFIHFNIFSLLRSRVRSTTDYENERCFKIVQFNTHYWALSKIQPRLYFRYLRRALFDVFEGSPAISPLRTFFILFGRHHRRLTAIKWAAIYSVLKPISIVFPNINFGATR